MAFDLDRAIDALARHEIYSIVDLHALPDWQNQHWHSDNPTRCRVWDHRHFQDRVDDQDQADRAAVEDPFNPTRICPSAVVRSRYHYAEPVFSSQSLDGRNSFGGLRTFDLEAQHLDQPSVVRTGIGRLYWWSCKIIGRDGHVGEGGELS